MRDFTNQYELKVRVNAKDVTEFNKDNNVFIEGRKNSEYTIGIQNYSDERVLAILSIDGVCVLDQQPAGLNSTGFILDPWEKIEVPGWPKDKTSQEIEFYNFAFANRNRTSMSNGSTTGVIGLLIFREKKQPQPLNTSWSPGYIPAIYGGGSCGGIVDPSDSAWLHINGRRIGSIGSATITNFPTETAAATTTVTLNSLETIKNLDDLNINDEKAYKNVQTFEKRDPNYPDAMLVINYDDIRGLEKRGILVRNQVSPQAFPRYKSN